MKKELLYLKKFLKGEFTHQNKQKLLTDTASG